ncbi:unnamed protein product [Urochloa decumbens]|uniref:NB-ARC domain-containing protein n=1 Tax=Urochloa decumbens TaxID=240449 RepID=A0ABC9GC66_9POAL
MEILISAVIGELVTRSINFIINKIPRPTPMDVEDRLHKVLLRAQIILDEAMGRHITNQAMLLQLSIVRDAMYRGYYMLDTFSYQSRNEDKKDKVMTHLSSSSQVHSVNFSSRNTPILKQLQETLDDLTSLMLGVQEFVVFLTNYPRMSRQPYNMHLQLANCMFGRQMEAHLVINFLLHVQPHSAEELEILPIVGPSYVGKSTLVAHVCKDERVRAHFSEILFFHFQGFKDEELATFKDECELKHQNRVSESNLEGRLLVIIELIGDLNEDAWNRLYSTSKRYAPRGSKIIVTSRFDNIVKYGTTQALTLKFLSHEAYWYFFKTLTFGSMDPDMHPKLMRLAMEIAKVMGQGQPRCHLGANINAHLLKDNFDVQFWFEFLAFLRQSRHHQKLVSRFGEHPSDLPNQNIPILFGRMSTLPEDIMVYNRCQHPSEGDVPKIKFQDVLCGSVKSHGKFEVLAWRSRIPPYHSYTYTCEIGGPKTRLSKRKRSMKNGVVHF